MARIDRSLLLVIRSESIDNFREIARRVRKIDPAIDVLIFGDTVDPTKIPSHFLKQPLLSIYLVNPPPEDFVPQSGQLAVKDLNKLKEYEHFKKHNIPCLPIEEFKWGMTLDESIYGDWVVLKPQHIQSTGRDINMIPTKLIPTLKLDDFPEDHLIREDSYYVQKFIQTGDRPTHYRVLVFCGQVLYIIKVTAKIEFPKSLDDTKVLLRSSVASNVKSNKLREVSMSKDQEIFDFALKVAATQSYLPLFGFDILRNEQNGELLCLEQNSGGNVWHFSSNISRETGMDLPSIQRASELIDDKKSKINQYGAWDRAAKGLIRKVYEFAK